MMAEVLVTGEHKFLHFGLCQIYLQCINMEPPTLDHVARQACCSNRLAGCP